MTSPKLLLLLLLSCAMLCLARGGEWQRECPPVKTQEHVDLNKVEGRWYIIEGISPGLSMDDHNCNVLDISISGHGSYLLFRYHQKLTYDYHGDTEDEELTFDDDGATEDDTAQEIREVYVKVVTPSRWIEGGEHRLVVDLPPDGNTLTLAYCTYGEYTVVYGRNTSADLRTVHARLKLAGVAGLEDARPFNRTGCPTIVSSATGGVQPASRFCVTAVRLSTLLLLLKLL